MASPFERLTLITGSETAEALQKTRVIVVGLGGVGSWCAEALVRSGVGNISIVDFDTVCVTNINRQVQATSKSVGRLKAEVLKERLTEINPLCEVKAFPNFFASDDNSPAELFDFSSADYIIDAIDILKTKLDLIETALTMKKRLFSSMGMALRLDPTLIKTADIWKTKGCSLARLVRQGLKKRKVYGRFMTVYSEERLSNRPPGLPDAAESSAEPDAKTDAEVKPQLQAHTPFGKKRINGSAVPVTATAGMILSSLVIRDVYARFNEKPVLHQPDENRE